MDAALPDGARSDVGVAADVGAVADDAASPWDAPVTARDSGPLGLDAGARIDSGPRDAGPAPVAAEGTYILDGVVYTVVSTHCGNFGTRMWSVAGESRASPLEDAAVVFGQRPITTGVYTVVAPLADAPGTASLGALLEGTRAWGSRVAEGGGYSVIVSLEGGRFHIWFNDVPVENIREADFTTLSAHFTCPL